MFALLSNTLRINCRNLICSAAFCTVTLLKRRYCKTRRAVSTRIFKRVDGEHGNVVYIRCDWSINDQSKAMGQSENIEFGTCSESSHVDVLEDFERNAFIHLELTNVLILYRNKQSYAMDQIAMQSVNRDHFCAVI